jgi:hypothetical protein
MAENKRSDYEIERDREEIAALLARNRRMSHQRIADTLNRRRVEEYRRAISEAMNQLGENDPIPDIPQPYTLTRQMIDYDVKALEREFRKRAAEKYDTAKGYQLHEAEELLRTAWVDYERSKRPLEGTKTKTKDIELRTTEQFDADGLLSRRIVVPARSIVEDKKIEQHFGDPRYLGIVRDMLVHRAELMNLIDNDVNLNVAPTDVKLVAGFNPAEWDKPAQEPTSDDDGSKTEAQT